MLDLLSQDLTIPDLSPGPSSGGVDQFASLPPNESMWNYNCLDCVYTREVGEVSADAARKLGLSEVDKFQHRVFPAVLHAMLRGVRIDHNARSSMASSLRWEIDKRQRWLKSVTGFDLNPRSPKQMQAFFYQDLGLPIVWKRRPDGGKSPSLDDAALELLKRKEPLIRPLVKVISEIRTLGIFASTFVGAGLDEDGRMRCSYNICGTETFRFSSSKNAFGGGTNLQNVPRLKGQESDAVSEVDVLDLPNVRSLFVPDEGMEFFDLDLSKADLRIVAWESECKEMKAMLAEGRDPYIETAREYYRDPSISKYTSSGGVNSKYDTFKSFSHGTHYLGTPQGLSQRIGLTVHEATKTQAWYFGKYPEIKRWQERFVAEVKRTHSVSNKFGYIRRYFGRIDDSTCREAIAWLPQSTVGVLINHIWVGLWEGVGPSLVEVLLQVHDSLGGQFPQGRRDEALAAIRRAGEVVIPYDDPLVIPVGVKTSTSSWGACE